MKPRMPICCLCLFLAYFFSIPLTGGAAELPDRAITFAVERQMADDPVLPAQFIDVETRDGVVLLSGWVDNLLARERAVEVAETLKGVRAVVNQIAVDPIDREDEDLIEDIREALAGNPAVRRIKAGVEVQDGIVTLTGIVEDLKERRDATRNAYEGGAREVRNFLRVREGPKVLSP